MQLVRCKVKLGNDPFSVIPAGYGPPGVSFAETYVLAALHGPGSVTDIEPAGEVESTSEEEFARLRAKYGPVVERLFPGINPDVPMEMPVAKAGKKAKPVVDEP